MLGALAEAALSRPRAMLGAATGVLIVLAIVAAGTPQRLGVAGPGAFGSESDGAADELSSALGHEPEPGMLIVTRGRERVDSPVYGVALDALTSQAQADPEVADVRQGPVSRDERTTVLEVYFRTAEPGAQQQAADRLVAKLDPGPLTILVGGEAASLRDARRSLGGDLPGLELLALPLTLVVLVLAVGARLAVVPLACAAISILGALAAMRLLAVPLDISATGAIPAAVAGLALGVELPLMLVARYRAEARGASPAAALDNALTGGTGKAILAAGVAGAVAALALLALPFPVARSAAAGTALAAALAAVAALTVTPSALALFERGKAGEGAPVDGEEVPPAAPVRLADAIAGGRRTVAAAVCVVAAACLLAMAAVGLDAHTLALSVTDLPPDAKARSAEARLAGDLGASAATHATVAVPSGGDVRSMRSDLRQAAGVGSAGPTRQASGEVRAQPVGLDARRGSLEARNAVGEVRVAARPSGGEVSGPDAASLDADTVLGERLAIAAAIAALALALVVLAVVRRPVLAIALGLSAVLPAAAAGGVLAAVFGDGLLTGPLDYSSQGEPHLDALICALAGIAAVSAARSAAFASSAGDPAVAPTGLVLPAAGAATVVAGAGAAVLVGSDLLPAKEVGLAVAVGLALDLVLVRVLLAPGLAGLLKRGEE